MLRAWFVSCWAILMGDLFDGRVVVVRELRSSIVGDGARDRYHTTFEHL